jgi:TrmH family RNA methyltransferase
MISKKKAKFIKSLQLKKFRQKEKRFLVEGAKSVLELLRSKFNVKILISTPEFSSQLKQLFPETEYHQTNAEELSSLGSYQSNDSVLAVVEVPEIIFEEPTLKDNLILALDGIRDPGNLGAILRIADWYGLPKIYLSPDCAELYNPKTIQASMGSFLRVKVFYIDLIELISSYNGLVYGALLEGENLHRVQMVENCMLVIGNESNGIRPEVLAGINQKLKIPGTGNTESLNAAMATAIFMDNYWRMHH